MAADIRTLAALRLKLSALTAHQSPAGAGAIPFGARALDAALGGGLARGGLHEVYAPTMADFAAATGFSAAIAMRAAGKGPVAWVRQDFLDAETGRLHPSGLAEWGVDPNSLLLVRARDAAAVLRAGGEAARCPALGALVLACWGEARLFDLTASRRLALAAEASGVTTLVLRVAVEPEPSAAVTRWAVRAAPSRALEANAPGFPAFSVTLLRHRAGLPTSTWRVEWNRDQGTFDDGWRETAPPLPRPVAAVSSDRPAEATNLGRRRAG